MRKHRHQLDASVEASGPHDFAVRVSARSSVALQRVHRIPHPTFVTIAKRPSYRARDGARLVKVICPTAQEKNIQARGLDEGPNQFGIRQQARPQWLLH